jgi:DNA-binding NtrC family response regulator
MNKLRILHLEDQPDFSALVAALFEKEGLQAVMSPVTDFASYNDALENDKFDVILADYSLPTCNGMQALLVARQKCPEVPFLLVSGAIGEHAAVDILQSGAIDYVLKSGLERLVPAIRRAVQETRSRNQKLKSTSKPDGRTTQCRRRTVYCLTFRTALAGYRGECGAAR